MGGLMVSVHRSPYDQAVEVVREEVAYALRRVYRDKPWASAVESALVSLDDQTVYDRRRHSIDDTVLWLRRRAKC